MQFTLNKFFFFDRIKTVMNFRQDYYFFWSKIYIESSEIVIDGDQ